MSRPLTDQEFRDIWLEASEKVADRFYPKGDEPVTEGPSLRGNFIRDQAVLYCEMVHRFTEAGLLDDRSEIV